MKKITLYVGLIASMFLCAGSAIGSDSAHSDAAANTKSNIKGPPVVSYCIVLVNSVTGIAERICW